jgi:hypothetical protein
MEDILDVYQRPHDPECPMVCVDETSKQLIAETRVPIAAKPGRAARYDYEYRRNGTANLFMMFAPLEGWRHVKVTDRHTALAWAKVKTDKIDAAVLAKLHASGFLPEVWMPDERLRRVVASWLNERSLSRR